MIFIPKIIIVGFGRHDSDLAFVIYEDEKGIRRKVRSWDSWRDKTKGEIVYSNGPQTGLLLNKAAGGEKYSWDKRQNYARVTDARGFTTEITMENLVYLLKTSGYDPVNGFGELVYGFDAGKMVLVPTASDEYKTITDNNKVVFAQQYLKPADLIPGHLYKRKSGNVQLYLGKFKTYSKPDHAYAQVPTGNRFWFAEEIGAYPSHTKSVSGVFIEDLGPKTTWSKSVGYAVYPQNMEEALAQLENEVEIYPLDLTATKRDYLDEVELEKNSYYGTMYLYSDGREISFARMGGGWRKYSPGYNYYNSYNNEPCLTAAETIDKYKPYVMARYMVNGKRWSGR